MTILNYGHPLTAVHLEQIAAITGQEAERVVDLQTQFDEQRSFAEQAAELATAAGLSPLEWQTLWLLLNPPTLHVMAVALLAELHGRMGYFPAVLRMRRVEDMVPPRFEVAEIMDLHAQRGAARTRR